MYKFLKKPKFIKIICFLLVCVFSVNVAGCGNVDNGLDNHIENAVIGLGSTNRGYTVYAESTFNKMDKEVFIGYLLSGRDFTLYVVPGKGDGSEDYPYQIASYDNVIFKSLQNGVYKYNEATQTYEDPSKKLLVYYVTDNELRAWFNEFAKSDSFMNKVMNFFETQENLEDRSRFKCELLVNMGSGLDAGKFCGSWNGESYDGGFLNNSSIFGNSKEGGAILLFGFSSIEGYITYNDIVNYRGSYIANSLMDPGLYGNSQEKPKGYVPCVYCYNPDDIKPLNYNELFENYEERLESEYGYSIEEEESYEDVDEEYKQNVNADLASIHTEKKILSAKVGYDKLKTTYELLGSALLADNCDDVNGECRLSDLKTHVKEKYNNETNEEEKEILKAKLDLVEMIDTKDDFNNAAFDEAFNIKLSVALYSRHSVVIDYPDTSNIVTGYSTSNINKLKDENDYDYERTKELINGQDTIYGSTTDNSYLLLVTADGFVIDRGTKQDQEMIAAGFGDILSELIRMDSCPNKTIAKDVYEFFANLKIVVGTALTLAGTAALILGPTAVKLGFAVCGVLAKLGVISAGTPIPGARIVAIVLVVIAALVALGVGLYNLITGIQEHNRLKGLGASEENYCETYVATFNLLFETMSLSIPVYHYNIPRENDSSYNDDLSIVECSNNGRYDSYKNACIYYDEAGNEVEQTVKEVKYSLGVYKLYNTNGDYIGKQIPLYYYANRKQSEELSLDGCPILMYFKNGQLADSIYGASTPGFIIEMLRLWGLLATREIVYRAELEAGKINVYHTSNTNARTQYIKEATYCYTLEYNKDLREENMQPGDFCYGKVTKSINYKYSGGTKKLLEVTPIDSNDSNFDKKIEERYGTTYFEDYEAYKYNAYKNDHSINLISETEEVEYELDGNRIKFKKPNEEGTYDYINKDGNVISDPSTFAGYEYEVYGYENSAQYYIIKDAIYKVDHLKGISVATKIATYTGNITENIMNLKVSEEDTKEKLVLSFISYIVGTKTFENLPSEQIPIYFTVMVEDNPQTDYYYDNNNRKHECDTGEHAYDRDSWWFGGFKCLADEDVKTYDEAIYYSNDSNYYSSSILIATVEVSLNSNGEFIRKIVWKY